MPKTNYALLKLILKEKARRRKEDDEGDVMIDLMDMGDFEINEQLLLSSTENVLLNKVTSTEIMYGVNESRG